MDSINKYFINLDGIKAHIEGFVALECKRLLNDISNLESERDELIERVETLSNTLETIRRVTKNSIDDVSYIMDEYV